MKEITRRLYIFTGNGLQQWLKQLLNSMIQLRWNWPDWLMNSTRARLTSSETHSRFSRSLSASSGEKEGNLQSPMTETQLRKSSLCQVCRPNELWLPNKLSPPNNKRPRRAP